MTVENKSEMLKATYGLKNMMGRHYLAIQQAYRDNKPTAWAVSGTPVELLYAMDVQPMLPENSATMSAAQHVAKDLIEIAEDQGFSYDICSYFKTNIGAVAKDIPIDKGGTKKPTFMISSDAICDTHVNWFQVQAERFNVPHFTIDVPHVVSNTNNRQLNYYRKYVEEQLHALNDFITEVTGHEQDPLKTREVIENSYDLGMIWQKIYRLRKCEPSPISTKDTFGGLFPLFTMTGLRTPINFYKRMYREAKARVDAGVGALDQENYRLMFEGIPFWYNLKYFAMLEQFGGIFVYEPYTYAFSKYTNPNVTKDMILKDPIKTFSELVLKFWYIYDLETRVKEFAKAAEEYKVDGIVLHNNMSCRPNTCTFYDLKRRLQEDYDIPCLIIDSDQNDVRKFNETQITNKIESFIEILSERKKR